MASLKEASEKGSPIFGICNGFQILCEAGLLPGVLLRNDHGQFLDQWTELELENSGVWSPHKKGTYRMPLAHADGRFFINDDGVKKLEDQEQIWLRYKENPNGSVGNIAGVMNKSKNVMAMMPHPDRATHNWMGSDDGLQFFQWN